MAFEGKSVLIKKGGLADEQVNAQLVETISYYDYSESYYIGIKGGKEL